LFATPPRLGDKTFAALLALSNLKDSIKHAASIFMGLGSTYSFAWFSMFLLSPSLGRSGAHNSMLTEFWVYISIGSLLIGILILATNLLFGFGAYTER
jgi:hypothetical protein